MTSSSPERPARNTETERTLPRREPTAPRTPAGVSPLDESEAAGPASWQQALAPSCGTRWRQEELTVNHRTPAEVMAAFGRVRKAAARSSHRHTRSAPGRLRPDADAPLPRSSRPGRARWRPRRRAPPGAPASP